MFKDSFLAHLQLLLLTLCFSFAINAQEPDIQKGKSLFNANCAACHKLKKRAVGPALAGVSAKYDKEWLYTWIKNSTAMVKSGDAQAVAIYEEYNGSVMTSFPQLSNEDIDNPHNPRFRRQFRNQREERLKVHPIGSLWGRV